MTTPFDPDRPRPDAPREAPIPRDATIPREALERVLARATELQARAGDEPEGVSEARLLEIAREVGIDTQHLRQAIAEERTRGPLAPEEEGPVLRALGPATVSAQRTVAGTPADVLARLDAWMPRMESLVVQRRLAGRAIWEPRRDAIANLLASFGLGGRRLDLVRSDRVQASAEAVDATRTVVRLDADLHRARRTQRTTFVTVGVGLNLVAFGVLSIPLLFLGVVSPDGSVAAPAMTGAIGLLATVQVGLGVLSWRAMRRGYRDLVQRTQLRLEQLLDELERGGMQPPATLLGQVRDALLGAAAGPGRSGATPPPTADRTPSGEP
jgi:hypothetical protein